MRASNHDKHNFHPQIVLQLVLMLRMATFYLLVSWSLLAKVVTGTTQKVAYSHPGYNFCSVFCFSLPGCYACSIQVSQNKKQMLSVWFYKIYILRHCCFFQFHKKDKYFTQILLSRLCFCCTYFLLLTKFYLSKQAILFFILWIF